MHGDLLGRSGGDYLSCHTPTGSIDLCNEVSPFAPIDKSLKRELQCISRICATKGGSKRELQRSHGKASYFFVLREILKRRKKRSRREIQEDTDKRWGGRREGECNIIFINHSSRGGEEKMGNACTFHISISKPFSPKRQRLFPLRKTEYFFVKNLLRAPWLFSGEREARDR